MILKKCSLGQVDLNCTHRLGTSLKLEFSDGHNLLKMRCFLTSTFSVDVKKTPHMLSLDKI